MEDVMDTPQCWMPERILVSTGFSREPIDIVPFLIDEQDEYAPLMSARKRLEFPTDMFPASWDNQNIVSAVKTAAAEADNTNLTIKLTEPKAKNPSITLACEMSRSYRAPKSANEIQAKVYDNTVDLDRIDFLNCSLKC